MEKMPFRSEFFAQNLTMQSVDDVPNPLINSVKTPGSLSIKHQSPAADIFCLLASRSHMLKTEEHLF